MASSTLSERVDWSISQLKIVLLGGRNSGKSSVGNLILGKEEFVTKERTSCSRRLGVVAGRWITVVDTPGWWCDFSAGDTSTLVKREIVSSVSLCPPGPHVFLIVIKASSTFSERRCRAVEEHVDLLGDGVWGHCLVVFTSADEGAEECVERGGPALRRLTEKCGRRSHSVVLNDSTEGAALLLRIQGLMSENGNRAFEMEEGICRAAAEEKKAVEQRAHLRLIGMKRHRALLRDRLRPLTNIRIVLLGAKGSGKTSALNTILSRECRRSVGRTARCQVGEVVKFGRQLTVVDTPGWWMNYFSEESSHFDRREIVLGPSLCPPGPHVFLLAIRVDRAFTETHRRSVQEHVELISERIWSRVVLLFTFGDWLGATTTEQYIESEGRPLQWLVDRCGNRYHVLNSRTKGEGFQVRELIGKIEETVSGCCSGWHYEIETKVLQEVERRRRREAERVGKRTMEKDQQRHRARAQLEKLEPLPELRLILVGGRKVGKSSCGNTILTTDSFGTNSQTTSCTEKQGDIGGKKVSVLDTPGCFPVTSDLLTASCAVLLVVNISSSFADLHREALEKQLQDGGRRIWKKTMVLFSHGDWLGDTSAEQRIEGEGEPLRGLVERAGNRYHVLDNKNRGDGAQVRELLELVEEMLVEERLDELHRRDHVWKGVSEQQQERACGKDLKENLSSRHPPSHDSREAAAPETALVDALVPAGGARRLTFVDTDALMSYMAAVFYGRQSSDGLRQPAAHLPFHLLAPHRQLRLANENRVVVFSRQTQQRRASEEDAVSVRALCHPALRGRALRRLSESGNLQALIDQWGCSSLKELEDFIDSYFEMVWEQTMESLHSSEPENLSAEMDAAVGEIGREELLLSIDRKLSKLDILEEIRNDVAELRQNLESSWRAIQQLREKHEKDSDKES
ncbi:hypothetical protein OJAV_G00082000 [Oryzias javanicus]|uniref:AIG1-type G domain-containing protein n=1 Tax=Oryzias javanicus TaxID=123683 RepID=A0A437D497_ORYJA|nr:hypothetical protein OJAV_G00082000 [Oryzias javanicus]